MPRFCDVWRSDACDIKIDPPNIKVEGDFFIVTGTATNRMNCILPHLQLQMMMHYKDPGHPPMRQDIFHITDRALEPDESRRFKIEGEYEDEMDYVEINVWPSNPKGGLPK